MPVTSNQINLQTSFSKLAVLYYLLKVVKDNEPTTRAQTKDVLFPIARSKLKSTTTPWDPNKADTHARITLEEYGLIEYDPSDAQKFSVSKLGNGFLSSFNLVLNPVQGGLVDPEISPAVDPDEATYLIWRILCATHITNSPYDIHPYRILMALLSRQELDGYITKREWAHFLVNTSYDCDAKLDLIATSIKSFRSSVAQQDLKSTDRVLGRLKDWNVLEPVSRTAGDTMAFRINESFKWVVQSNLTNKERAMIPVDRDLIKKLFEDWVQTQPSLRGGNVTLAGAQHYSYELENDVSDPLFSAIPFSSLFQITDADNFAVVKTAIENVQGFATYDNARGNGYFSRAMTLYDQFLNDPSAYVEVKKMVNIFPYLAAIRTKPFILLAGISGTGKSRIVRQLARGCCPETDGHGNDHPLRDEQKPGNYELIPVRPNWHDSTELMGYVTRITGTSKPKYVLTPFVKFLVKAWHYKDVPFFLCLDEMNLAPVEQYFAEYLSKIETRKLSRGDIVTDVLVEFPDEILDSVLSEISREIPLIAMTKQTGDYAKPEAKKRDKDTLYKLWDEFLIDWPISRLREIGLEEYTKAGSDDTFTYALEFKLANLGSIGGGSAFKFGIFSRDPNGKLKDYNPNSKQIGTNEYAWYRKFGLTKEAAWDTVKEKIVLIAEAAASGNFAAVDKIDFPHVVKWKIAFLYQDRKNIKIVDIYKKEWVVLLTSGMPRNATFAERYLKLNEDRKDMDVFEWDDKILSKRRAELLGSDDDFDSDEEEESTPADTLAQSPVLEMIKRDKGIRIPPNLVVMGTVNMDETTCSFSRKVLDRAMSFELNDVEDMYTISTDGDPNVAWGAFNNGVVNRAKQTYVTAENLYAETDATKKATNMAIGKKVLDYLKAINAVLDKTPFKVAYRTRNEIMLYCVERGVDLAIALDEVTSMKILSRIEGDENAVRVTNKLLESAAVVPTPLPTNAPKNLIQLLKLVILKQLGVVDGTVTNAAVAPSSQEYEALEGKYKICAAKLDEMNDRLLSGYTGFWR